MLLLFLLHVRITSYFKIITRCLLFYSGYYIHIETSYPRKEGDNALLVLKPVNGTVCLRFYYHMYGEDIGSLNVYVNGNRVFHKNSNQGNKWLLGEIEFHGVNTEVKDLNLSQRLFLSK